MTRKKLNKRHGGTRKSNRKAGHQKNKRRTNNKLLLQEYGEDNGSEDQQKQSKAHKKSMKHALRNLNSMLEMNQGDFSSLDEMAVNSLDMASRRPSKADKKMSRMAQIADFTDKNHRSTMTKALRKFPVEFVKAQEVYNPSEQLFKSLGIECTNNPKEDVSRDDDGLLDPCIETDGENMTVDDEILNEPAELSSNESVDEINSDNPGIEAYPSKVSLEETSSIQEVSSEDEDDLESVQIIDDNEDSEYEGSDIESLIGELKGESTKPKKGESIKAKKDKSKKAKANNGPKKAKSKKDKAKKGELKNDKSKKGELKNNKSKKGELKNKKSKKGELNIDTPKNDESKNNESKNGKPKKESKRKNAKRKARNGTDKDDLTLGKILAPVHEDENGDSYITLPKIGKRHRSRSVLQEIEIKRSKQDEQDDTEFGFLPEDYNLDIDISQIKFDNIRYGSCGDAQYHVKAKVITGMKGYQWLSKEDFLDSMVEIGLTRNRFDAFIRYALENLYTGEEPVIDVDGVNDEDEEDEDENENDESYSDSEKISDDMLEGLDDMISFQSKQVHVVDDPVDIATHSLDQHGHGKNRKLDLPEDMDPELREMLVGKFESRVEGSRHKRREREEKVHGSALLGNEGQKSVSSSDPYYMLKKYPYEMQIGDFRSELESFFMDDNRNSLRFPPMDTHGCMTLRDMSRAFHMKARKFGKAPECYIVSVKTSASKRQPPDYREVDKLMNRRKLFFRSDAGLTKREKKEIGQLVREIKSGGSKKGKKGAFTYSEGDIVGANASRIGPESIGRQLLVKMGWQNGEALGKEGNKGIIEPIAAVVKTTKAGIR
ncbi:hypothetical protein BRETT_000405 [Brettanomyces bruxellensis]|uniref:G-patch domain-containing protein n=1 Tax=Dekkera bruxellensis TaxID=5007 RepID=A0A871R7L1_DEKBR|nr:uncharacterized protein BRETT_000405 [Brettanomyces bruxellensis]QOU20694.1 hypothetical protein BRETT_000405 [Brettanomyces bruxellensis]